MTTRRARATPIGRARTCERVSGAPPVERSEGPALDDPRLEAALDRDREPDPDRGDVAVARESEQQGDDAGPLTHAREYATGP